MIYKLWKVYELNSWLIGDGNTKTKTHTRVHFYWKIKLKHESNIKTQKWQHLYEKM